MESLNAEGSPAPLRSEVDQLLKSVASGDGAAQGPLVEALGAELHQLAERLLVRQPHGHTLQPTALVNEAWMRLFGKASADFNGREHFMNAAAVAMRSILVDHARRKQAAKRGGGMQRHALDAVAEAVEEPQLDLLALDEALSEFEALDAPAARIVELRFFAGREFGEIAELLGIGESTVFRRWRSARAWLLARLGD